MAEQTKTERGTGVESRIRGLGVAGLVAGLLAFILIALSVSVAEASAAVSYEQVSTFNCNPEPEPNPVPGREEAKATAVNYTGNGGVPIGTVYTLYESLSLGKLLVQCGPNGEPVGLGPQGERLGVTRLEGAARYLAVDQSSGDVFVLVNGPTGGAKVQVFEADGAGPVEEFGKKTEHGGFIASTPEQFHNLGGIVVDASCDVYIGDVPEAGDPSSGRVMVFEPAGPGCSDYSYAGRGDDFSGLPEEEGINALAIGDSGHLFVAGNEYVYEYALSDHGHPVCTGTIGDGGLIAMTASPETATAFYIDYKDGHGHQLNCDNGQLVETGSPFSITPPPNSGIQVGGLSMNPVSTFGPAGEGRPQGILYAADPFGAVHVFARPQTSLPIVESTSVSSVTATSALVHGVINPKGGSVRYRFEYLPEVAYDENTLRQQVGVSAGGGDFTLSAAATSFGPTPSTGPIPFDATAEEVRLALEGLSTIGSGNVNVTGGPGDATGSSPYRVEFVGKFGAVPAPELLGDRSELTGAEPWLTITGTFADAGNVPAGGAALGGGQAGLPISVVLPSLSAETSYRYRVVAIGEREVLGPVGAFRTFPLGLGLLDNRAYEMVSPPEKHGGEVFPINPGVASCTYECKPGSFQQRFPTFSSGDGNAIAYEGFPFTSTGGASRVDEYVSRRTGGGWKTVELGPPAQGTNEGQGTVALSTDLTRALNYQVAPTLAPGAPEGFANLYLQQTAEPMSLLPLLTAAPLKAPTGRKFRTVYVGASADLSRVFFMANYSLTTSTAPQPVSGKETGYNLYEWSQAGISLVNVTASGAAAPPGATLGGKTGLRQIFETAVSSDGSHVFWTSDAGQLFVRLDGEVTKEIPGSGGFVAASADGTRVLRENGKIYGDFELGTPEEIADLTGGNGGFKGIAGHSTDLSWVYFTDEKVLATEPNSHGESAAEGANNLYGWHEGSTFFIGQGNTAAESSPSGRWLAFTSEGKLTGTENVGPCRNVSGTEEFLEGPCQDVYLYDSAARRLICVSCSASGSKPLGGSYLPSLYPSAPVSAPQPRYLTDDGRLFFDSQEQLSPADTNGGGKPGHAVEDVYEYEPYGVGSCSSRSVGDGCISLISAGTGTADSNFVATDESGANVFFTTRDRLVAGDRDELYDLYDAREDGGIEAGNEPLVSGCQGETCQATPPTPPQQRSGSGVVAAESAPAKAASCRKGLVKRGGKCVKKKRKARKHETKPKHPRKHVAKSKRPRKHNSSGGPK